VGKADVHVTNAQSTRPLGRRAIEPQLRTPAFPIDHLDLLKGQTLGPSSSEGLETCLLGGEPGSERPRAFRATGAGRTLFSVKTCSSNLPPSASDREMRSIATTSTPMPGSRHQFLTTSPLVTTPERPIPPAEGL